MATWLVAAALLAAAFREFAVWVVTGLAPSPVSLPSADFEGVLFDPARNPPWLVFGAVALLLLGRVRDLRATLGAPGSPLVSAALMFPALAMAAWARLVAAPDLLVPAFVTGGIGVANAMGGSSFARKLTPPLLLLLFAMPLPGILVNRVVFPLQLWTADYTALVLQAIRYPALHLADTLRTARSSFIVIEECSGLGSIEVLTVLALAYAWFTRARWQHALLLGLAAPAIAFGLNGLRVVLMVLRPGSEVWSVHTTQGLVVFAVGALAIAGLDVVLSRWWPARPAREGTPPGTPRSRPPAGVLAWLAALALLSVAVPRYEVERPLAPLPLLPESLEGFDLVGPVRLDQRFLGSVGFSRWISQGYLQEDDAVALLVAEDDRGNRFRSGWSAKNRVPGSGWVVDDVAEVAIPGRFRTVGVTARGERRESLTLSTWWNVESLWVEVARAWLGLDQSPFRREAPALLVRAHTTIGSEPGGARRARERLTDLLVALNAQLVLLTDGQIRRL